LSTALTGGTIQTGVSDGGAYDTVPFGVLLIIMVMNRPISSRTGILKRSKTGNFKL
jgi:hypothetical protein